MTTESAVDVGENDVCRMRAIREYRQKPGRFHSDCQCGKRRGEKSEMNVPNLIGANPGQRRVIPWDSKEGVSPEPLVSVNRNFGR